MTQKKILVGFFFTWTLLVFVLEIEAKVAWMSPPRSEMPFSELDMAPGLMHGPTQGGGGYYDV